RMAARRRLEVPTTAPAGVGLIYVIIRRGMNIQKQWVAEKLDMTDRVTQQETQVVSNIEKINEVLLPIEKRFGTEKANLVRSLIYKQAEIGIKRNLLGKDTSEVRKAEINKIIEELGDDINKLRNQIGVYCMMMVREVYAGMDTQVFNLLNARIASAGTGQKGGGIWDRVTEKVKDAELQELKQSRLKAIKETSLFKELSEEALTAVAAKASVQNYGKDEALMRKGDPADSFFVILKGSLKIVTTDSKGDEIIINKVDGGETIGELALIDQLPRSAGAIALEDVEALELTRDAFFELLDERFDVSLGILRGFSNRLRFSTTYIEKVIDWSQKTAEGDYSFLENTQPIMNTANSDDAKASQLLFTFYSMVSKVKEREEGLKQQLEILTFQIDQ
ncbi:MAG TPA: cyclic nucleotide-binding domain-containing protein, partial [Anaerolineales bacterium]|nr:cyclic nucleotide-binding domain-containing protein [Anaerolineales bacterium]